MSTSENNHPVTRFCPVSQLESRSVSWLWPERLAVRKLSILDGDPGLGKSLVTLDVCARLSTGQPFPDGSPSPGPANSVVLASEDEGEDTIRPRLAALGADLDRVYVPRAEDLSIPLRLPSQTDGLAAEVARVGARLVVIDPIMAFFEPRVQINNDQSVRWALYPLAQLARKYECAIWLVRHLSKRGSARAVYRGGGSIGLSGACRSVWLIAPEPSPGSRRVLAHVKNNLGPLQPSLAFETRKREDGTAALVWQGVTHWSADDLLGLPARQPPSCPREAACEFLTAFLQPDPRTSQEIWAEAEKLGLSEATLYRAKLKLEIRSEPVRRDGRLVSYWLLRGQELPAGVRPDDAPPSLEPWLAPLREQFPPPTPIDDL
jgi:hypothetical protein